VAGAALLSLLGACNPLPKLAPDNTALTARAPGTVPGAPDCASCHAYPLHDINHQYHLISANVNQNNLTFPQLNNVTTCMDCHFNSIQHFTFLHSDTTWFDSNGIEVFQHTDKDTAHVTTYQGWRPLPQFPVDTTRGRFLAQEIDSLIFRYARIPKHVPWRTGPLHDNGVVDVALAPNDVTSPASLATAYRPRDFSCSDVACHNRPAATYRFMDPSRGLSNCPSLLGNDPTCNEFPAAAKQGVSATRGTL
jgi:hypothetical protein